MTVDSSYMAWARPTRRVHLALSVGMTVTGIILIAAGSSGGGSRGSFSGGSPERTAPALGRIADSVVSKSGASGAAGAAGAAGATGATGGPIPAAPMVPFAPAAPVREPAAGAKAHSKPRPHAQHAAPVPKPESPAAPNPATGPVPTPARHLPRPADLSHLLAPILRPSSQRLPAHPLKH